MYLRTNARGRSRFVSRMPKAQTLWVTPGIGGTVVGGAAGAQALNMGTALISGLAVQNLKGIKLLEVRGELTVVPTVAPAAGTKDTFTAGICVANNLLTPQQMDPSLSTTRDAMSWAYYDTWVQPYVAAPVGASQVIEARHRILLRKRRGGAIRVFRNDGDTLWLCLSSAGTESWSYGGHLRLLVQLT